MASPQVIISSNESLVSENLCKFVVKKANDAIREKKKFTIGVSGGSLAKFFCKNILTHKTDWSKWQMFFCDERYVPYEDPDCTYKYYKENLSKLEGINIFPIDLDVPVEESAANYAKTIQTVLGQEGVPRFDMLLLGMGPDGHTCSLFPKHCLLEEKEKIVAAITDSPKPPPCRVTLTFPVLNNTACAVFASCGAGKADIIQKVLEPGDDELLPASRVRPTNGELVWFLDDDAYSKVTNKL